MNQIKFVVPTLFGLEGLVAEELRRLNLSKVQAENGRVRCQGTFADVARMNICLRTGERVLIELGQFPAGTFDQLFEGTKALNWEDYLPKDAAFPVKGYAINSALHSVPDCQAIIKKSVADRLGSKYGCTTMPETGVVYQIQFSIMKDTATLMIDTSGPGLHKRGYRAKGVVAPLRETLAAAMVTLARYRGQDPLCDPFCGSGTIPIEGALIAKNVAPGLSRSFRAQKYEYCPSGIWLEASTEAMDKEFDENYEIYASDIDPKALEIARANAKLADVDDIVDFEEMPATEFHRREDYGRVVTNPPYGERIMERSEAQDLYRSFGEAWKKMGSGWRLYLLSSHTELERCFGKSAEKKRKLYNGMLKCDLFMFGKV